MPPDAERSWPGRTLAIGDALVGLFALRQRCVVTTIDPDTGEQDMNVLRRIHERFVTRIALNSRVVRPGVINLGDPVRLVDVSAQPEQLGGWILGAPYEG